MIRKMRDFNKIMSGEFPIINLELRVRSPIPLSVQLPSLVVGRHNTFHATRTHRTSRFQAPICFARSFMSMETMLNSPG
jgi:hypothetical protein